MAGYRAGVDPLFLAAAVPARAGERVLELGCGVGTALFALGCRVPGLTLTGVELQPDCADLARRNAAANHIAAEIIAADVTRLPAGLRAQSFDHVMANPPYFDPATRTPAAAPGRETALAGGPPLAAWCDAGLKRLAPGGYLTLIQAPERLPELLEALVPRAAVTIHPLAPRIDRDATRVILWARKGSRASLRLAAPTVLHDGARHESDGEDFSAAAEAVLRGGAPWPWVERLTDR